MIRVGNIISMYCLLISLVILVVSSVHGLGLNNAQNATKNIKMNKKASILTGEANPVLAGGGHHNMNATKVIKTKASVSALFRNTTKLTNKSGTVAGGVGNKTSIPTLVGPSKSRVNSKTALLKTANSNKSILKVFCIGDSITWGTSATNRNMSSFPAVLNEYLKLSSQPYNVYNYGIQNKTIVKPNAKTSYWNTSSYVYAIKSFPDIIIFTFGYDISSKSEWNEVSFVQDYISFIKTFKNTSMYLTIPPPYYASDNKFKSDLINKVLPRVILDIARKTNRPVIDLFRGLGGPNLVKPFFYDTTVSSTSTVTVSSTVGVYPNDFGNMEIAHLIAAAILGRDIAFSIRGQIRKQTFYRDIHQNFLQRLQLHQAKNPNNILNNNKNNNNITKNNNLPTYFNKLKNITVGKLKNISSTVFGKAKVGGMKMLTVINSTYQTKPTVIKSKDIDTSTINDNLSTKNNVNNKIASGIKKSNIIKTSEKDKMRNLSLSNFEVINTPFDESTGTDAGTVLPPVLPAAEEEEKENNNNFNNSQKTSFSFLHMFLNVVLWITSFPGMLIRDVLFFYTK